MPEETDKQLHFEHISKIKFSFTEPNPLHLLMEYTPVCKTIKSCNLLSHFPPLQTSSSSAGRVPVIDFELAIVGAQWDLMEQNMLKVLLLINELVALHFLFRLCHVFVQNKSIFVKAVMAG